MKKEDYLRGLKEAERVEVEVRRDAPPEPKAEKPAKPEAAPPAEPATPATPATPAPAEPVAPAAPVATAPPVEPELFPGFASIPPEIQASIKEKFRLAEEAKAKDEEARRVQREFMLSQQRLAPMQQQLSKAQTQAAELARQVEELRTARATGNAADVKARLDSMRESFPDDAALFEAALQRAADAEARAAAVEGRFGTLEQRLQIESQLRELTDAHPDWKNKRIGVIDDEHGQKVFRKTVDTPDAAEMEVWANALDPYDKQIIQNCILSLNARDTIYALNRFEHDRAVAKVLAAQNASGVPSPSPGSTAAPPAALPTPAADPNPQQRITAPPRAAGQPVSEKKRELIEAARYLREQESAKAKRA